LRRPCLHDLLPTYRVVDDGTSARRLTSGDIARLGGDAELAAESFARRARLLAPGSADSVAWWPLVGVEQDAAQSLVLSDGTVLARPYTCLPDSPTRNRTEPGTATKPQITGRPRVLARYSPSAR
jgi:hypothetical protein